MRKSPGKSEGRALRTPRSAASSVAEPDRPRIATVLSSSALGPPFARACVSSYAEDAMKITVHGAGGGEVTGSACLLQTKTANVLVDFGMYQGAQKLENHNKLPTQEGV